jgi:hypothetical protein
MVSEIFPRTTKVAAFPTSGVFSHIHVIAPLLRPIPKPVNPPMLARTLLSITWHLHCLPCLLAKNNNVMKPYCAVSEWYNWQLLQPVHEFVETVAVIQPSHVNYQRFAIPLTASSISQIRSHPVFHLKTLRFVLQLYALSSYKHCL